MDRSPNHTFEVKEVEQVSVQNDFHSAPATIITKTQSTYLKEYEEQKPASSQNTTNYRLKKSKCVDDLHMTGHHATLTARSFHVFWLLLHRLEAVMNYASSSGIILINQLYESMTI